jgi:hypothetical protein
MEDLVFILAKGSFQFKVGFSVRQTSFLNQSPESGVVKVIYMAVNLPPIKVVSEVFKRGIDHYSAIETRNFL